MSRNRRRLKQIQQALVHRQVHAQAVESARPLVDLLNNYDIWDTLAKQQEQPLADWLCNGPRQTTARDGKHVGVVVWLRRKGFVSYQELTIFGVWASASNQDLQLSVGTKVLSYAPPTYNPESYHKLIKRDYSTYYSDSFHPPTTPYMTHIPTPEQRIAGRSELKAAIQGAWMAFLT